MQSSSDTTTLIVVSYNKRPYTELCLRGQFACDPRVSRIVVVDNGSQDGSVEALSGPLSEEAAGVGIELVLIANDTNVGACTARNQGLEQARGDYIAVMDNDITVRHENWLEGLHTVLAENEQVGICGPKLLFPFDPFDIQCAGVAISPNGRVQYRGRGERPGSPAHNVPGEVQCLISACWLMRRAVVEEAGGFDEAFNPAQFEDFDLCYRAREAGWKVHYEPSVEMYHFENVTTDNSPDVNYRYVTMKNWAEFKRRWQHRFAREGGPPDAACGWKQLPTRPLEQTGIPPTVNG